MIPHVVFSSCVVTSMSSVLLILEYIGAYVSFEVPSEVLS